MEILLKKGIKGIFKIFIRLLLDTLFENNSRAKVNINYWLEILLKIYHNSNHTSLNGKFSRNFKNTSK